MKNHALLPLLFSFVITSSQPARAELVHYALEIAEERWSPDASLRPGLALTVNGGIPGPTLRFREGDFARIRVT
ncbi:MAG: multicopper oxidase domain-containing protein, partial [Verrucomicrobiales bacterium]|nr:multicopper oxidase domain-containing protein [Verrucomicrobiales bacterium]